jgi:hypothetical protein
MSKVSIVYIGKKPKKKDTVTGSRLVFTRLKPVDVDSDIAEQLLDYPGVWVLKEDAKEVIAKQEAKAEALAKELNKQREVQNSTELEQSMIVIVDEEKLDIGKYSSNQLDTLVESEDLTITEKKKPVPPYRLAIRNALREKNGMPDSEDQE